MQEIIHSVGIDIGTSTTQLIFSKLTVENRASSYTVPRIDIVEKEVIYRSNIYFTPLLSNTQIDVNLVKQIVEKEYAMAGKKPGDLNTGAVIITGETARKENANEVLEALSEMAGDFVVATAGPDLESVLSARGAGADKLSEEDRTTIANLDIGGGTTNIAVYQKGKLQGVSCLDIGGRLVKVENGVITYVFRTIGEMANRMNLSLKVGDPINRSVLEKICDGMAEQLAQAIHLVEEDAYHKTFYTNEGKPLNKEPIIKGITYSGGVADCIYSEKNGDVFQYGDIGILLGNAIRNHQAFQKIKIYEAKETIRATVVGAGTHTTEVSGSTISYDRNKLPVKNIPILRIAKEEEEKNETIISSIRTQLALYGGAGKLEQVAIALSGASHTGFTQIQELADSIIEGGKEVIQGEYPLIIVVECDIGKALGHALKLKLEHQKEIICIDGIVTTSGDYIDIGLPIADGRVVPVVIKTLIFNT